MRHSSRLFRSTFATATVLAAGWSLSLAPPAAADLPIAATAAPVFLEDFEAATDDGGGTSVREYVGGSGIRYDAADFWADRAACNGFIVSAATLDAQPGDCLDAPSAFSNIRALAAVLGVVNGTDPATNSAVTAYTQVSGPDNAVELETTTPVPLTSGSGRFLTASVNVASVNCFAAVPTSLRLALRTVDGVEHPVSVDPVDPCTDERSASITLDGVTARAGHFDGDAPILVDDSSVGVVMRNENGGGSGNDHAFDDLSVTDVTPMIDVELSQESVLLGETVRLRFDVRNTPEHAAKAGWSVDATLPDGLVVASDPQVSTTCTADITAAASTADIRFTGELAPGEESCTVEVDTTPVTRGTLAVELSADAVRGLDVGTQPVLNVIAPLAIESPAPGALVESALPVFSGSGEPGSTAFARDHDDHLLCETVVDASGRWACRSTVAVGSGEAVVRVEQAGAGPTSTSEQAYRVAVPALAVDGSVRIETLDAAGDWTTVDGDAVSAAPGDRLRVAATITNTGENALGAITPSETPDTRLVCDAAIVEPGSSVVCTSTEPLVLTRAMLDAGTVVHEFEAVLTGYSHVPETRADTSPETGRLPLPDAPQVSTGLLRTTLGVVWRVAPLEPHDPLARTGIDTPLSVALLMGGLFAAGTVLVGAAGVRRRRDHSSVR